MRSATIVLGLVALVMAGARAPAQDKKADPKGGPSVLVGAYSIVKGENSGRPEPDDRVKGTIVRFSEDRVVVVDKQSKEIYGASYTLDTSRTPWRITLTSKLSPAEGQVAKGLIEKDGDNVRLIYSLPGGQEPTSFKTKDKQLMFEMKPMRK